MAEELAIVLDWGKEDETGVVLDVPRGGGRHWSFAGGGGGRCWAAESAEPAKDPRGACADELAPGTWKGSLPALLLLIEERREAAGLSSFEL